MRRHRTFVLALVGILFLLLATGSAWAKGPPAGKGQKVDHTARQERPILLGVSGGSVTDLANGYCCSGTLGALVQDQSGIQYILSNTHVFAGDMVSGGNGLVSDLGDPINQPGYVDVRCADIPADYVAALSDWIPLEIGGYSTVDAATAEVIPGTVDPEGKILEIGAISADTVSAFLDQPVKKSGRTSGLTKGKVAGLDATVTVQYTDECAGESFLTVFTGQILVTPGKFLKAGDSGSLMVEGVEANPRAVGLLYAGSNRVAVANPINDVLAALGVTMVGTAASAATSGPTQGLPEEALLRASQAKARHADRLMQVPESVGHALGAASGRPGQIAIKVLVEKANAAAESACPREIDGVPVEIWEVGKVVAY